MEYGFYDAPLICLTISSTILVISWMFKGPIVRILETLGDLLEERR